MYVRGVILASNNLSGFDLSGLDLSSANLINSNLSGANLVSTNLNSANFDSANVSSANLSSANLVGADLMNAVLMGTNLHRAILPSNLPSLPVVAGAAVLIEDPLVVVGEAMIDSGGQLSIRTSSFTTAGLNLNGGAVDTTVGFSQDITGHGVVRGDVSGAADETITASGGSLILGDVNSTAGFDFGGALDVAAQLVILHDADQANLGVLTNIASGGRLAAPNPIHLRGTGILTATGDSLIQADFKNDGQVNGPTAAGQFLSFNDNVNGDGNFSGNIEFRQGFSPGNSPAVIHFAGNLRLQPLSMLQIEIGRSRPEGCCK